MDALMENDINMECTIGVSAGAMGGMCYVAGDIGRAIRVNVGFRNDPRYVGVMPLFTDDGVIGFNFVFNETPKVLEFNYDRFFSPERRFACVVTNCWTGKLKLKSEAKSATFSNQLERLLQCPTSQNLCFWTVSHT